MKNKQHIIDCLRGKNPVRNLILVEKRTPCAYAVPKVSAKWHFRFFTNLHIIFILIINILILFDHMFGNFCCYVNEF